MGSKRKRTNKEAVGDIQPSQKRSKNGQAKTKTDNALDKSPFTEQHTVEQRRRELEIYELLGSEDIADRINAADAIISGLLGGDGVPESVLLRHLDKRLFRGLASGRNASRLGFSLVLTEILGQLFGEKDLAGTKYTSLTFDKVLGLLVEKTHTGGSIPGQEERNHFFGQLFGLECFIRADILYSDKTRWFAVLDLLLKLAEKKSWLKPQCGFIVAQAVAQMKRKLAEKTLQVLAENGYPKTPEGVGIWIAALDRFPEMQVPSQPWKHPLAATSLSALPAALKDTGSESTGDQEPGKKQKTANWTARLHFVWDTIVAHFVKLGKQAEADAAEQFKKFWNRVVDEGFFSKGSSDSQKFSGFMIFQKMLEGAQNCPFVLPILFSKNFMACLMNQASVEDRYLHRAALKALKAIEAATGNEPSFLPTTLKQLLGNHGAYNFDQRTNTKTVDKLLQKTSPATIKAVLKLLQLKDPSKSGLDEAKYYQALGNYLYRLSSTTSESDEESKSKKSVPGSAIQLLTELAYSNKSVPENIKEALRTKSTSAFAKLVKRPEDFGHLCNAILAIETDLDPEDEMASSILPQAYERLKDLLDPENETDATKGTRRALALLHSVGILQFYNQDPDVMDLFEELEECYDKLADEKLQDGEGISEYLVEILLAMVARPSSLMRQVSQQVFEAFTGLMSAEALELLTGPLAADESAKGQQALFSTEDEDMHDAEGGSESGSDEEELDSDVEIVNLEEAGSEDGDKSSGDEEDDEEEEQEEEQDKDQEALEALDNALADVLQSHRLDKDNEAESEPESDMSDSEMMAVDEKLAEIFKLRAKSTSKKKDKRDAKDTVVNFKHRVLDLLAIFVKKEATTLNPLAFGILLPLLQLVRTTTTKALANKACDILINFSKGLKKARASHAKLGEEVDADAMTALLRELHDEAPKDPSHAFARAVSTASLAVASVLCGMDDKATQDVFQLYAETQLKWYRGQVKIQPAFFSDWLHWCQSHVSTLAAQD
ncbi:DNA polymerase phi-domain-containing protein [Lasiosphaeria miniovina]|uniref:DNA polymerase phi-domain-containing protein n=1 Tax=Lasiosphaeria miniovina TaxID=1954250 RepID=A0AA40EC30_9PEZI|nr:DNA polymerase phi-domain-containing protein [Lasiosphaeria miniovina]KAK0734480.1 DNA polymerase phi-domain-containing protein [Lasiosphaeria miniovina]